MHKQYLSGFTKPPVILIALFTALLLPLVSLPEITQASMTNTRADAWNTNYNNATSWMTNDGGGVDVYSNGSTTDLRDCSGNIVTTYSAACKRSVNSVVSGAENQCVELFNRLYLTKGWISSTWSGNGNQLYNIATLPTGFSEKDNTHTTFINPGDAITFDDGGSGHVVMVDSVSGTGTTKTVNVVSQNTQGVLWTVSWNTSTNTLTQTYLGFTYQVQGIIHRPTSGGGTGGHLTQINNDGSGWHAYDVSNGYQTKGTPFTLWGSGVLDVFAIDANGGLDQYHQDTSTGVWTVYQDVVPASNNLAGGVSGVLDGTTLNLFTTNTSGQLIQTQKPQSGSWAVYTILGSSGYTLSGRPALLWTSGSVSVFADDTAGDMLQYYVVQGQTNWVIYKPESSIGLTGGATVSLNGATTSVFTCNTSHHLIQLMGNGGWGVNDLTQAAGASANCNYTPGLIWGSSTIDLFTENSGSLQQYHLNLNSGGWQHYDNIQTGSNLGGGTDASMWGSTTEVFGVSGS